MKRKPHAWLVGVGLAATTAAIAAYVLHQYTTTYLRFRTRFGRARVYQVLHDDGTPVRLLEVGGIVQSGTFIDDCYTQLVFEYLKRYDLAFQTGRPINHVCVLGCGGYDYPEHLIASQPHITVDAVEIDPAITAIARQYFFLDRLIEEYRTEETGLLNLICADALDHLQQPGPIYDVIVNDAFDAGTPPAHLTGPTFVRAVHERLSKDGLFMTNIVSALEGPNSVFLHEQVALFQQEFAFVSVFPCAPDNLTAPDNVIVVATDVPLPSHIFAGQVL